jgi:hypothetical protein
MTHVLRNLCVLLMIRGSNDMKPFYLADITTLRSCMLPPSSGKIYSSLLKLNTAGSSWPLLSAYQTIRSYIPHDINFFFTA